MIHLLQMRKQRLRKNYESCPRYSVDNWAGCKPRLLCDSGAPVSRPGDMTEGTVNVPWNCWRSSRGQADLALASWVRRRYPHVFEMQRGKFKTKRTLLYTADCALSPYRSPPEKSEGFRKPRRCWYISTTSSCPLTRGIWTMPSPTAILIVTIYIEYWAHLSVTNSFVFYISGYCDGKSERNIL